MAGVPQNFQAISNVLPTYNFVDITAGTGYINFYAGDTVDLKVLSNFSFYADTVASIYHLVGNFSSIIFDHDYDTLLNRPLDIKGLGIVNVPVFRSNLDSIYVIAKLRKWDGVTETDIVSNTSRVVSGGTYSMLSIDLNIPLTHFKIGEYMRLTIEVYGTETGGDTSDAGYAHDPKGRTTGWDATGAISSQLIFQCPVRLNL